MSQIFSSNEVAEILKGGANHYRVDVLFLLEKHDGMTLEDIAESVRANYKTIAVHLGRMHKSGLISKKYRGSAVEHRLTPRGVYILKFLRKLE
ncbi:ArsR family transcriptional regulator, partial [Candidatus Saccharibacteria bacterium]|nr:ArsR family transcriptional regulator [Candidatus Saccharibacteria bacterium]